MANRAILKQYDPVDAAAVAAQAATIIEPADDDKVSDDAFETSINYHGSSSVSSSVRDDNFGNGRCCHKFREGRYPLPNDIREHDREYETCHVYEIFFRGELHFAPIGGHPQNIIDLGTGTGIWCINSEYPEAPEESLLMMVS